MKTVPMRPISRDEAAVVRQALLVAPVKGALEITVGSISTLNVVATCECGCRSVRFEGGSDTEQQIADGVGMLESGERVDVIVWGRGSSISFLELVDHAGGGQLPVRVLSWDQAGS